MDGGYPVPGKLVSTKRAQDVFLQLFLLGRIAFT